MPNFDQVMAEPPVQSLCKGCGKMMAQTLIDQGIEYHPTCDLVFIETERRNHALKDKLMEVINYVNDNSERSLQMEIGPSEMGYECDARIGRILAGMPKVNYRMDMWAAIVGTSIHKWLEEAVISYQHMVGDDWTDKWRTEEKVQVDDLIPAHTDLWDGQDVVDYKGSSPAVIKDMRLHGPPVHYKIQIQLYGKARARTGQKVRDVVLVFLPRVGWLKDMYIWRQPYDEAVADAAIARVYGIGKSLIDLQVVDHPERWAEIPRETSACWYCPFYTSRPAPDDLGCPGKFPKDPVSVEEAMAKFDKGLIA